MIIDRSPFRIRPVRSALKLALAMLLVMPAAASGQDGAQWPGDAFVNLPPVATGRAATECVMPLVVDGAEGVTEYECRVSRVDSLTLPGSSLLAVGYRRLVHDPTVTWQDTLLVFDLTLFESDGARGTARPVWHRSGYDYFLSPGGWSKHGDEVLFQSFNCVRGTGGCVEDVLLRNSDGWHVVELSFLEQLADHVPAGYSLHKGRRIDLETLEFRQPVARAGDANCCPSGLLSGTLVLEGTTLRLVQVAFETVSD